MADKKKDPSESPRAGLVLVVIVFVALALTVSWLWGERKGMLAGGKPPIPVNVDVMLEMPEELISAVEKIAAAENEPTPVVPKEPTSTGQLDSESTSGIIVEGTADWTPDDPFGELGRYFEDADPDIVNLTNHLSNDLTIPCEEGEFIFITQDPGTVMTENSTMRFVSSVPCVAGGIELSTTFWGDTSGRWQIHAVRFPAGWDYSFTRLEALLAFGRDETVETVFFFELEEDVLTMTPHDL